jgi:ribonuclease HII
MKKSEHLKQHKIALLISLVYDADVNDEITDICADVLDYLYGINELRNSTYIQEMANEVEQRITNNSIILAKLLRESLIKVNADNKKALSLIKAIEYHTGKEKTDINYHYKIETTVRKNYKTIRK